MRVVIIETQGFSAVETRASNLAFWHYIIVMLDADLLDAGFELCVLVLHRWLRRRLQVLRLGHCSEAETRDSTLVSRYCSDAEARPSSSRLGHCNDVKTQASTLACGYD